MPANIADEIVNHKRTLVKRTFQPTKQSPVKDEKVFFNKSKLFIISQLSDKVINK